MKSRNTWKLAFLVLSLLTSFLLVYLIIYQNRRNLNTIKSLIFGSGNSFSREMEILKIDSLQQINKRLSQEITKMNAKLPSERNLSSIFATVNESASRFNLKIFRIEPGEQSGDSVNSYLAFLLETRGSFSSTVGFIHEIENCSPVFCVETITMDLVNNSRLLDTKIVLNALLKKGRNEKSEN